MFSFESILSLVPPSVQEVFDLVRTELDLTSLDGSVRREELLKVRDQLCGGSAAIGEKYHPAQHGLTKVQQAQFRRVLERSHVNLVEPALDRLVNSIHSGKIRREARGASDAVQRALKSRGHASVMARLCENAYAYGTGYLVPLAGEGEVRYWLPDPIRTVLVVDPSDIDEVLGVAEWTRVAMEDKFLVRFVTKTHRGWVSVSGRGAAEESRVDELSMDFAPVVVARGRDMRHQGEKYGRSLVVGVAEATIRVTNNEVNLELLRDRQTQALLIVQGNPQRTSVDDGEEGDGKYMQFPRDGGDAKYATPESRIEAVIELTKRFCEDAAISSGLPLDTFLPSLIAGADASATAARIRAFPLQQRMARLVNDWEGVEEDAAVTVAAAFEEGEVSRSDLRERVKAQVTIRPSLPEADAETLANWQQKTANFMARIEDAIEFYSADLSEEEKAELARAWRIKNDPTVANGAADELAGFKREIAKALYGGATTKEVMANLTDLRKLVDDVGLPREASYEEPWLPVVSETGPVVTGEALLDEGGDVVGGVAAELQGPGGTPGNLAGGTPAQGVA